MTIRTLMTIGAAAFLAWPTTAGAQSVPDVAQGAQVWARNCVRCHNARPSVERTDAAWVVIVNHMRARANLTRTQGRMVTAFLQATNGPEGTPAAQSVPTPAPEPKAETEGGQGQLSLATLIRIQEYLVRLAAAGVQP